MLNIYVFIWSPLQILRGKKKVEGRPGASLEPVDFDKIKENLVEKHGRVKDVDVISASLYPKVTDNYLEFKETYGPVGALDTKLFFSGPKMAAEVEVTYSCFFKPFKPNRLACPYQ